MGLWLGMLVGSRNTQKKEYRKSRGQVTAEAREAAPYGRRQGRREK